MQGNRGLRIRIDDGAALHVQVAIEGVGRAQHQIDGCGPQVGRRGANRGETCDICAGRCRTDQCVREEIGRVELDVGAARDGQILVAVERKLAESAVAEEAGSNPQDLGRICGAGVAGSVGIDAADLVYGKDGGAADLDDRRGDAQGAAAGEPIGAKRSVEVDPAHIGLRDRRRPRECHAKVAADERDIAAGADRQAIGGLEPTIGQHPAATRRVDDGATVDPHIAIGGDRHIAAVIERWRRGIAGNQIIDPQAACVDQASGVQFDVSRLDGTDLLRGLKRHGAGARDQLAVDRDPTGRVACRICVQGN